MNFKKVSALLAIAREAGMVKIYSGVQVVNIFGVRRYGISYELKYRRAELDIYADGEVQFRKGSQPISRVVDNPAQLRYYLGKCNQW